MRKKKKKQEEKTRRIDKNIKQQSNRGRKKGRTIKDEIGKIKKRHVMKKFMKYISSPLHQDLLTRHQ